MKCIDIFTLVPEAFSWLLEQHPVSTALTSGVVQIAVHNIRKYSPLSHYEVDDTPYGGGPGMVGRVDIMAQALSAVFGLPAAQVRITRDVYVMAAGGRPFTHDFSRKFAESDRDLVLLCGRFEGFDARVENQLATGSISIGPYVLAGGEVAAMVIIEAMVRHLPGSLGNVCSVSEESFSTELEGMLEYPHYTRPREFEGEAVPDVLLSGDHGAIADWRKQHRRPSPWKTM